MPIVVSSTPTIDNFLYSDVPLTMSVTGSGLTAPYNKPYWESLYGTFSDYLAENPLFDAIDRTQIATITGRRVARMYATGADNWSNTVNAGHSDADYGTTTKTGGADGSWDAKAVSGEFSVDGTNFISFRAGDINKDKAGGLTDNGTDMNPTQSGFRFAWWLKSDGTAVPYHTGTAQAAAVPYTTSTVFKIYKSGSNVSYIMDGVEIASVATGGTFNYYPILTFQDSGASIKSIMFYKTDGVNYEDDLTFQVYGVFPEQPNYSYEITKDNKTLASAAEDGSSVFRVKSGIKRSLSLTFSERPYTEYQVISEFWDWHQKHIKFYYRDLVFEEVYRVVFDSGLRFQPVGPDRISITAVVREI